MAASNPTSGVGLALTGAGAVFIFAGIKGFSVLAVIKNVVSGQPATSGVSETALLANPVDTSPKTGMPGPFGAGSNQAIGKNLAGGFGWGDGAEWDALVMLWEKESNWDNHADNPSSHAYGIPQALPYTKMPKAAWPESAGGQSDPTAQIQWGLDYIRGRYGSPTMAWAHEQANGWY
jgi:hypothetical protein